MVNINSTSMYGTTPAQQSGGLLSTEKTLLKVLRELSKVLRADSQSSTQQSGSNGDSVSSPSTGSQQAGSQLDSELHMILSILQQLLNQLAADSGNLSGGAGQGGGQSSDSGSEPQGQSDVGEPQSPDSIGAQPAQGQSGAQGQSTPQSETVPQSPSEQSLVGQPSTGTSTWGATGSPMAGSTSSPSTSTGSPGATVPGEVGTGTNPLTPVPLNGGANKQTPTSLSQIDGIIKSIDPSLLTDPSQVGTGALKGLPYGKLFEAAGKATGINPTLLYADAQVESGDNANGKVEAPNNINPIQTAPGVWATSSNEAENLFMGAYVMKSYIDQAGGNLKTGLDAYNTGDLNPSDQGYAAGFSSYYAGVMSAQQHVLQAVDDPSLVQPGQGANGY